MFQQGGSVTAGNSSGINDGAAAVLLMRLSEATRRGLRARLLLRSTDRGDHWTEISPDLSTNDTSRILRESEGSVPGGIPWFAITSR